MNYQSQGIYYGLRIYSLNVTLVRRGVAILTSPDSLSTTEPYPPSISQSTSGGWALTGSAFLIKKTEEDWNQNQSNEGTHRTASWLMLKLFSMLRSTLEGQPCYPDGIYTHDIFHGSLFERSKKWQEY